MRVRSVKWTLVGLALAMAGFAQAAGAQVSVTPFVGAFLPLSPVFEDSGDEIKQKTGVMFGGRLTYRMQGNWAVEGEVAYASSKLEFFGLEGDGGSVIFFGGKALYFFPTTSNMQFHAGAGLGFTSRGGDDWDGADESSSIGGILNVGITTPISRMMKLRIDIEDYITSISAVEGFDSKLQNDILVSIGLMIPFGAN